MDLDAHLTPEQRAVLNGLDTPVKIQAFLDGIEYRGEDVNRSPIRILDERQSHCFDGGLFAAAALRRLGYRPLLVDLFPDPGVDDDHILAVYSRNGYLGAVAKSNYVGLRFREAVYRNLRELVLSYFNDFYNVNGERTLRQYTRMVDLSRFDSLEWMWNERGLKTIELYMYEVRRYRLVTDEMAAQFSRMDERSYQAGLIGANEAGLYQPAGNAEPRP